MQVLAVLLFLLLSYNYFLDISNEAKNQIATSVEIEKNLLQDISSEKEALDAILLTKTMQEDNNILNRPEIKKVINNIIQKEKISEIVMTYDIIILQKIEEDKNNIAGIKTNNTNDNINDIKVKSLSEDAKSRNLDNFHNHAISPKVKNLGMNDIKENNSNDNINISNINININNQTQLNLTNIKTSGLQKYQEEIQDQEEALYKIKTKDQGQVQIIASQQETPQNQEETQGQSQNHQDINQSQKQNKSQDHQDITKIQGQSENQDNTKQQKEDQSNQQVNPVILDALNVNNINDNEDKKIDNEEFFSLLIDSYNQTEALVGTKLMQEIKINNKRYRIVNIIKPFSYKNIKYFAIDKEKEECEYDKQNQGHSYDKKIQAVKQNEQGHDNKHEYKNESKQGSDKQSQIGEQEYEHKNKNKQESDKHKHKNEGQVESQGILEITKNIEEEEKIAKLQKNFAKNTIENQINSNKLYNIKIIDLNSNKILLTLKISNDDLRNNLKVPPILKFLINKKNDEQEIIAFIDSRLLETLSLKKQCELNNNNCILQLYKIHNSLKIIKKNLVKVEIN